MSQQESSPKALPAGNSSTDAYTGTHFQNLPAELLQQIAKHTFDITQQQYPLEPSKFLQGVRGMFTPHSVLRDLTTFRLLCHSANLAGRVMLIKASSRPDYLGSQTLYLPPKRGSLEDLLRTFNGTGLGAGVKVIELSILARNPMPPQGLMSILWEEYQDMAWDDISAQAAVHRIFCLLESEYTKDDAVYANMDLITAILDCLPAADRRLVVTVKDFWEDLRWEILPSEQGLTCFLVQNEPRGEVVHWRRLPQIFELINRYGFSSFHIDADSSLFGNPFRPRVTTAYPHIPSVIGVDLAALNQAYHNITDLSLKMTKNDMLSMRKVDKENEDYRHRHAYRKFLSSFKSLKSLQIAATRTQIGATWLETVLDDQEWPGLVTFNLSNAGIEHESMANFLLAHKPSLRYLEFSWCSVSVTRDDAHVLDRLPDLLTLKRLRMYNMHYAGAGRSVRVIFEADD